jgi:2-succinyl-6-hydroxy-2,4-cyclohexadiene-1-carboxylate synthase
MPAVPEDIVLLHGFAGTRRTWDAVTERLAPERYTSLVLDLPGHGSAADVPRPITFAGCVAHVLERSPSEFVLCGYSLGGRVALHVALAAPERVRGLVLVSCTAGIADDGARAARRAADGLLADALENGPFERFMDRWAAQPVFAHDPPEVHAAMRAEQLRNDPAALAAVLRGIGTGEMVPLWERLGELSMPVTVLVGERDTKFHAPGRRMAERVPDGELLRIPGGHRLPLEAPQAVARALAGLSG